MIALLLLAVCIPLQICADNGDVSPCATPTPTFRWDAVPDADLAKHELYVNEPGGVPQKLVDLPCTFLDLDEDGIADMRFCRGVDLDIPVQRYCPACQPFLDYEFRVKACDITGLCSVAFSNVDHACFSPLCVAPGPCN